MPIAALQHSAIRTVCGPTIALRRSAHPKPNTDELIAGGKAEIEDLIVEVAGKETYTFYIAPEHISVDADAALPELLSFEISIDHTPATAE